MNIQQLITNTYNYESGRSQMVQQNKSSKCTLWKFDEQYVILTYNITYTMLF